MLAGLVARWCRADRTLGRLVYFSWDGVSGVVCEMRMFCPFHQIGVDLYPSVRSCPS